MGKNAASLVTPVVHKPRLLVSCLLMLRFVENEAVSAGVRLHKEVFTLHCMLPLLTLLEGAKALSARPPCGAAQTTCSPYNNI